MFSYLMLCEFRFYKRNTIMDNLKMNSTYKNISDHSAYLATPHWLEYVIVFWVLTLFCQELNQVNTNCVTSYLY